MASTRLSSRHDLTEAPAGTGCVVLTLGSLGAALLSLEPPGPAPPPPPAGVQRAQPALAAADASAPCRASPAAEAMFAANSACHGACRVLGRAFAAAPLGGPSGLEAGVAGPVRAGSCAAAARGSGAHGGVAVVRLPALLVAEVVSVNGAGGRARRRELSAAWVWAGRPGRATTPGGPQAPAPRTLPPPAHRPAVFPSAPLSLPTAPSSPKQATLW
jgi:hypothetical protein